MLSRGSCARRRGVKVASGRSRGETARIGEGLSRLDEPVVIDVRGLKCPLPVLKAAKRMEPLAPGTRCLVIATDPMAAIDIPHFCSEKGHSLVGRSERDGELLFEIAKG